MASCFTCTVISQPKPLAKAGPKPHPCVVGSFNQSLPFWFHSNCHSVVLSQLSYGFWWKSQLRTRSSRIAVHPSSQMDPGLLGAGMQMKGNQFAEALSVQCTLQCLLRLQVTLAASAITSMWLIKVPKRSQLKQTGESVCKDYSQSHNMRSKRIKKTVNIKHFLRSCLRPMIILRHAPSVSKMLKVTTGPWTSLPSSSPRSRLYMAMTSETSQYESI